MKKIKKLIFGIFGIGIITFVVIAGDIPEYIKTNQCDRIMHDTLSKIEYMMNKGDNPFGIALTLAGEMTDAAMELDKRGCLNEDGSYNQEYMSSETRALGDRIRNILGDEIYG